MRQRILLAVTPKLRALAVPLLLTALAVWPLLLLAGFIIAAHWAAELACGWEWLRC